MTEFTATDYEIIHKLVFRPDYPGFRPDVTEIPNGDGRADSEKRYAHVAPKYIFDPKCGLSNSEASILATYYSVGLRKAVNAFESAGGFCDWEPVYDYSSLRILDYPPGAVSNQHRDFDLFTLMLYRDQPDCFRAVEETVSPVLAKLRAVNPQAHLGEIGELLGMGSATLHEVLPSATRQRSMVFFAIPDHAMVLTPSFDGHDVTVKEWLNSRMARSRTSFTPYK
jgi:hypothetical protein